MKKTLVELFKFQEHYLFQILRNIPESKLYSSDKSMGNSPGWILGHLIVEIEDIFDHLQIERENLETLFFECFKGGTYPEKHNFEKLPTKEELLILFQKRYALLLQAYIDLDEDQRKEKHPSVMFSEVYSNLDVWIAHHLITHVAVHIGNITTWKKMNHIEVQGI